MEPWLHWQPVIPSTPLPSMLHHSVLPLITVLSWAKDGFVKKPLPSKSHHVRGLSLESGGSQPSLKQSFSVVKVSLTMCFLL